MSQPTSRLPPVVADVLSEIHDQLSAAEDEAKAGLGDRDDTDASAAFVAGYLSAIIRTQAARLERILDAYGPEKKDGG